MSPNSKEWLREFKSFVDQKEVIPPLSCTRAIFQKVHTDLKPSLKVTVSKLIALHAVAAVIVFIFCPQLGVSAMIGGHGLMHFFMQFGPVACAALCGAIFLSTSAVLSTILLTREELNLANRYRFLNVSFLAALTFVGLILAGGEADRMSYVAWILGALTAGWITFKAGASIRNNSSMARGQLGW